MKKILLFFLVGITSLSFVFAFQPKRTECIAPANPGGGWDFTCRVPAAQVMKSLKIFKGNMKVTNVAGGGGGLAFSRVVKKRGSDENLIVAASTATATRLAQNVYTGLSADDVRWLGAVGADFGVLAVAKNSPYKNLKQLASDLKKKRIKFAGGSSSGGWDHLKVLLFAKEAGIKNLKSITYVSFDGGGDALLELIGKRADVFTGDTSEVLAQLDAGNVRILAVFSPERVSRLGSAKTAKEQGYDVTGANWRAFYAPKNISDDAYDFWVDAVKKVAKSSQWASLREKNGLAPFESFGADFEVFVREQVGIVRGISQDLGLIK